MNSRLVPGKPCSSTCSEFSKHIVVATSSLNWIVGTSSIVIIFLIILIIDGSYRQVPSFGRDAIRRFRLNCSELKNMAARDFENLLQVRSISFTRLSPTHIHPQCAIPVFDGLLPEPYNGQILRLLFIAAHWHGLAKLRLHNDLTLDVLDSVTESLGNKLREFRDKTCSAFVTRELEREFNSRVRREAKSRSATSRRTRKDANQNTTAIPPAPAPAEGSMKETLGATVTTQNTMAAPPDSAGRSDLQQNLGVPDSQENTPSGTQGRRLKTLNLNTYKNHSLGDYTATIRKYGTTDSYSTETVRIKYISKFSIGCLPFGRANWNIDHPNHGILVQVVRTSSAN